MDHNLEQVEKVGFDAYIYAIYAALIPLNMILNFTGSTINRYVGIIAAAFIGMSVLMKHKKGVKMPKPIPLLIAFTVWCVATTFWSITQATGMLITYVSSVALCLICVVRNFNNRELRLIKFFISIPSAILVFYLSPNKEVSYSRGTLTSSAGYADQNGLAANLVFAFWITIDLYNTAEKKSSKLLYAVCALAIIVSLLFIASRGAIVALAISALVYFFGLKKKRVSFLQIIGIAILVVGAYFIIVAMGVTSIERLSVESVLEDAGTGRFGLWKSLFDYFGESGVLRVFGGYGFGTEHAVTDLATGRYTGIHNTYLEYLFTTGIIGATLLISFLTSVFLHAKRKRDHISLTLMVALIVICLPLGFFLNKGAWNVLTLALIGLNNVPKSSNALENDRTELEKEEK